MIYVCVCVCGQSTHTSKEIKPNVYTFPSPSLILITRLLAVYDDDDDYYYYSICILKHGYAATGKCSRLLYPVLFSSPQLVFLLLLTSFFLTKGEEK